MSHLLGLKETIHLDGQGQRADRRHNSALHSDSFLLSGLKSLFLFCCLCQIPAETGNEELRQEHEKTNQLATKSANTAVLQ